VSDAYALRWAVGRWLRIRAAHETRLAAGYAYYLRDGVTVQQLFTQLAADAEHSALLIRLFEGKEPLPSPPPLQHSYPDYDAVEEP
jgi:hypothetical protein